MGHPCAAVCCVRAAFGLVAGLVVAVALMLLSPASSALAATIIVNTATDETGAGGTTCSLRDAIQAVDNGSNFGGCSASGSYGNTDTIRFGILDLFLFPCVKRIAVGADSSASGQPLPTITKPVVIDGYSQ